MNGLPISSFSTTTLSTRFSFGKRRDSSLGLGASVFMAAAGAGGGASPQEVKSAAASAAQATRRCRDMLVFSIQHPLGEPAQIALQQVANMRRLADAVAFARVHDIFHRNL